ncbi:MAG: vanadium-dependent haloperoxidase [Verrucomicrobiae bacterium]|nr:vanadium-dependent haloperoxidase [Verrucomicrobiae bacterium]
MTRLVGQGSGLSLWEAARLFALVNMAMADGYIAGWDSKLHYDFWRPLTAIRAGDTDGNPLTGPDANWSPLLPTPPIQDYPSTHSVLGDAAAEILGRVLGDRTPFAMESPTALDPVAGTRSFESFTQAADENGNSRVMAGIHFRFAVREGQRLGRRIGQWVHTHHLQPKKARVIPGFDSRRAPARP